MPREKRAAAILIGLISLFGVSALRLAGSESNLASLLPKPSGWDLTEKPATYVPGTLFEYINGAAENYLSYGFRELVVGNYKETKSGATLTVEIYDMEDGLRAFGIYSSERYPESHFLEVGNQGYWEEGALNFIAGGFYVKLLCFDCGAGAEQVLTAVAREIEQKIPDKGNLPPMLKFFSLEGVIPNSERFILQNVLGYAFLHHGYLAACQAQEQEFELFILQGKDSQDAQAMMTEYLEKQRERGQAAREAEPGYHVRDRYSGNIYLARSGNLVLGVMRIKDGFEELGLKYLGLLLQAVKNQAAV